MTKQTCILNRAGDYFWFERGVDLIGQGAFGQVVKGRNVRTGAVVAVKTGIGANNDSHLHELSVLRQLDSPYIIKYIDAQKVEDESGRIAIIMELSNTNLRDELCKAANYYGLPYQMLIVLIRHLERGLSYLNDRLIAHRDVKPANILIRYNNYNPVFKLCDFGGSRVVASHTQPLNSICGTPGYLNEFLTANLAMKSKALYYTKDECDLWAVGCTIYECATGVLPFLPYKGPMDASAMHTMMSKRPPDAICGYTQENGEMIWRKDLPDRCTYPRNLKRILGEFIRKLFDRRETSTFLFDKFSKMAIELTSMKSFNLIDINRLSIEEFFDVTKSKHFERVTLDQHIREVMPSNILSRLLSLPSHLATTPNAFTTDNSSVDVNSDVISLGNLNDCGKRFDVSFHPEDNLRLGDAIDVYKIENLSSRKNFQWAFAFILQFEKRIIEFATIIQETVRFCRKFWITLSQTFECTMNDLLRAKSMVDSVILQSSILSHYHKTPLERAMVENNAKQIVKELELLEGTLKEIWLIVVQLQLDIIKLDDIEIKLPDVRKDYLESVIKNQLLLKNSYIKSSSDVLLVADRKLVYNSVKKVKVLYDETLSKTTTIFHNSIVNVLSNMYDLPRCTTTVKKQLSETIQLILVTHETNVRRFKIICQPDQASCPTSVHSSLSDSKLTLQQPSPLNSKSATDLRIHNALAEALHIATGKHFESVQSSSETDKLLTYLSRNFPLRQ